MRPNSTDYAPYYETYISLVQELNLFDALDSSEQELLKFLKNLSTDQLNYAYAPNKWTVQQLLLHIIDTEIIFNYRALAFARGEQQSLPGYNHNAYADATATTHTTVEALTNWFIAARTLSKHSFLSYTPQELQIKGTANGNPQTVLAIGFAMCGHILHHLSILYTHYKIS